MSRMENVHLAPEGESDDLYSGYDYNDPMLEVGFPSVDYSVADVCFLCVRFLINAHLHLLALRSLLSLPPQELEEDPEFQRIVRTRYGQRPPLPVSVCGGC